MAITIFLCLLIGAFTPYYFFCGDTEYYGVVYDFDCTAARTVCTLAAQCCGTVFIRLW